MKSQPIINSFKNHVYFILDSSGSMSYLKDKVVEVFDNQIAHLAEQSKKYNQETRVSIYIFNDTTKCLIFDTDCLRLPSIKDQYNPGGNTALIDATFKSIEDGLLLPELYNDCSHLLIVCSDGLNNASNKTAEMLTQKIKSLPENWTIAAFAPNTLAISEYKRAGFPSDNISLWSATQNGLQDVGNVIKATTTSFMVNRSKGIRGTKSLFSLDTTKLDTKTVVNTLEELKPSEYYLLPIALKCEIKPFVESWIKDTYTPGSCYYQLSKTEKIQASKQICVQNIKNGKIYSGINARKLLGLPDYEVKVNPVSHTDNRIYVQSLSINRHLMPGTQLLVLK